jgi:beta-phosphoglucomutase-like phosphatase (HAD superfamily)
VAAARAAGMAVWAVTTTHVAADLADADEVFNGLPALLERRRTATAAG